MENAYEGFGRTGYEYDTLMNLLQVSVSKHLLDENFTLIWANDFYYNLIGYSREEYERLYHNKPTLYYMNDALGIHDEVLWKQLEEAVVRAINAGEKGFSMVGQMRQKNNSEYIWVRMTARFTDEYIDGHQVSYTAMTDISDVMRMQLEQTVTYDNLPGFVAKFKVSQSLDFTLLDANDRFYEFFGEESLKNMDYPLFRHNVERNWDIFEAHRSALIHGDPVHFTVQMSDRHGNDAWLQLNASCVSHQDGDPVYLVIYIDVTNETELRHMQKKLEEQAGQLRQALTEARQANRAKSDFLSRMSHDIRTPLNAVLGMKDIAVAHLDDPDKVRDCLKKIGLSGQHLLSLINDVLDMSKIESGEMALREDTVCLPEVLENIVTIMQPQFKEKNQWFSIRLQCVIHEQLMGDALRLRQVFLNILSNACKFTPKDGRITMDVRELSSDEGIAWFTFIISDSGIGMKPEFMEHLFTAFSREQDSRVDKIEGTGLGMAITKKIVDMLGGTIDVESVQGKGTTFKVTLPMKIGEQEEMDETFPDLKIIVADDDAIMCEYTLEMLERIGIYAECVSDGMQAVAEIARAKQDGCMYDAVFLDWKMPGLNGLETTRRIREICGSELPILIISAYDQSEIEQEARAAGINGFLQKPIFVSTLIRGLKQYVLGQLPVSDTAQAGAAVQFKGRHILLAEDNLFNQEVAVELLEDMGAIVDIADNGQKAVEVFDQSANGYYALILMDIQMPVMNGYTATQMIRGLSREDAKHVPIVAMTADAFAEDIRAAMEAGMNGHLAKPLDKGTLKREISKWLGTERKIGQ